MRTRLNYELDDYTLNNIACFKIIHDSKMVLEGSKTLGDGSHISSFALPCNLVLSLCLTTYFWVPKLCIYHRVQCFMCIHQIRRKNKEVEHLIKEKGEHSIIMESSFLRAGQIHIKEIQFRFFYWNVECICFSKQLSLCTSSDLPFFPSSLMGLAQSCD